MKRSRSAVFLAMILVLAFAQPAFAKKSPPPPPPPPPTVPVLLVHGADGSAADWATFQTRLSAAGLTSSAISLPGDENVANAQAIASFVSSHGWTRVNIVAVSMGGLSARYFVKDLGGAVLVPQLVTLGTPHYGVFGACLLNNRHGGQMCPLSSFLHELNATLTTPGPTVYTTISSTTDGIVPLYSSALPAGPGVVNLTVTGPNHDGLLTSMAVFNLAMGAIH